MPLIKLNYVPDIKLNYAPNPDAVALALFVKVVVTLLTQLFFQIHSFDFLGLARRYRF